MVLRAEKGSVKAALANVLMAYRATPYAATGETPYHLLTGLDMVLPTMQGWMESAGEVTVTKRMEILKKLREDAFERTARQAVARDANSDRRKSEPLEAGDLVLSWLDPNEKARLSKPSGGAKALPLWSGPCRVVRKLQNREDAYVVRRLWEGGKVKKYQRESLMKLPKEWDQESAKAALKEMLSDIRRTRSHPFSEERYDEYLDEEETTRYILREARGQQFIQDLTLPAPKSPSREVGAEATERMETGYEPESQAATSRLKRRKTNIQCVAWGEVESLLGLGK